MVLSIPDVIAFQELKMDYSSVNILTYHLKGYKVFVDLVPGNAAARTNAKRGVMIALHKSCDIQILDRRSFEGSCIMLKCKFNGKVFVIGNVYLESHSPTAYRELCEKTRFVD